MGLSIGWAIFFVLIFLLVVCAVVYDRVYLEKQRKAFCKWYADMKALPIQQMHVKVLGKHKESMFSVHGSIGGGVNGQPVYGGVFGGTSFYYQVLFEDDSGRRIPVSLSYEQFGMVFESDTGVLNYKVYGDDVYYVNFEGNGYKLSLSYENMFGADVPEKFMYAMWCRGSLSGDNKRHTEIRVRGVNV